MKKKYYFEISMIQNEYADISRYADGQKTHVNRVYYTDIKNSYNYK